MREFLFTAKRERERAKNSDLERECYEFTVLSLMGYGNREGKFGLVEGVTARKESEGI